ncbi:MAG: pseudaminic acid synthase [Verrucomicrobiota bacterium]
MSFIDRICDLSQPPVIVAELSGNHNQNLDTAKELIRLAAESGADAVKLQTYTADTLTLPSEQEEFIVRGGLWDGRSLHDLYQQASTPWEWHKPLAEFAIQLGIQLFSTPFDETAVDYLEETINPPLHKISSFEVTHIPLLEKVASTGKPVIISTGMATEAEIAAAVSTLETYGCPQIILLKCISAYPAEPKDFNLKSLTTLATRFLKPVGLSDHCLSNDIAIASVVLGARLIEKHFTNNRAAGGIDAGFSLEPIELADLVQRSRNIHKSLGNPKLGTTNQDESQLQFRRSIYVSKQILQGEPFTPENLKIIRPSNGVPPKHWKEVLGKLAKRDLETNTPLAKDDWIS